MAEAKKRAWMWAVDAGMNGAEVDFSAQKIYWFDAIGCACSSHSAVQSFDAFDEKGSPLDPLPDDIALEMRRAIEASRA